MKTLTAAFIVVMAGMVLVAGGPVACQSSNRNRDRELRSGSTALQIEAQQDEVLVGEPVALVAKTGDTFGRDAKIIWTSPDGEIQTNDEGRVARVIFLQPGRFSVRATLEVEGRSVQSDVVEIRVNPVR